MGTSLVSGVAGAAQQAAGQFDESAAALLSIGSLFTRAGANGFAVLAGNDTLPSAQRIPLMAMSSLFNDAACTMDNSFDVGSYFRTFDRLLGASGCSSTGGGDPWNPYTVAGTNPFEDVVPAVTAPVTVTPDAQQALAVLGGDPLPLIGQQAAVGALMARAGAGVTLP